MSLLLGLLVNCCKIEVPCAVELRRLMLIYIFFWFCSLSTVFREKACVFFSVLLHNFSHVLEKSGNFLKMDSVLQLDSLSGCMHTGNTFCLLASCI